jgi:hypothetical protein
MENPITSLKIRCVKAGTNISKLCEAAGVNPDTIVRWQKKKPKTFQILSKLDSALKKIEKEAKDEW